MTDFDFTVLDEVPTVRDSEPSPFDAVVAQMKEDEKARSFSASADAKNLAKIRRQLTQSGDAVGVTVRWKGNKAAAREDGTVLLTIVARPKIARKILTDEEKAAKVAEKAAKEAEVTPADAPKPRGRKSA